MRFPFPTQSHACGRYLYFIKQLIKQLTIKREETSSQRWGPCLFSLPMPMTLKLQSSLGTCQQGARHPNYTNKNFFIFIRNQKTSINHQPGKSVENSVWENLRNAASKNSPPCSHKNRRSILRERKRKLNHGSHFASNDAWQVIVEVMYVDLNFELYPPPAMMKLGMGFLAHCAWGSCCTSPGQIVWTLDLLQHNIIGRHVNYRLQC